MSSYSQEKLNLIKEYVAKASDEVYEENFMGRYDIIMVVDWREYDEDIIDYCKAILELDLSAETLDAENKQGFETYIIYNGERTLIPYQGDGADRDTTIIALNEVLKPDYEIRLCKISVGSDTLEFIPLPKSLWKELEDEYPDNVKKLFESITPSSVLFE